MSYNKFNLAVYPPPGSIAAYLGTSDPLDWVLCDGVSRTNDGRYSRLISLGIGSGTSFYTPPNLKGQFLYGSTNTSIVNITGGSNSVTLSIANLPSHTHTGTTDYTNIEHYHSDHWLAPGSNAQNGYNGQAGQIAGNPFSSSADLAHTHTFTTNGGQGQGQSFSIVPPSSTVNWIIKL